MTPDNSNTAELVPLGLLRRYLAAHGWVTEDGHPPNHPLPSVAAYGFPDAKFFQVRSQGQRNVDIFLLSEAGYDDIELVIPKDDKSTDIERRMLGAIETLCQLEDKSPDEIITSIRSIGYDVVRSRIPDALVIENTIRLESARNYIIGMKDLLAATATTELRPLPFFGRQSKEATDYSEKCRFGHTYRGSFGFTIESPLTAEKPQMLLDIEPLSLAKITNCR